MAPDWTPPPNQKRPITDSRHLVLCQHRCWNWHLVSGDAQSIWWVFFSFFEFQPFLGYPDDVSKFTKEQRENYQSCQVAPLPDWIDELNPELSKLLTRCWSTEPSLRSSMKELLREINTAKIKARESDSSLTIPVPNNPSGKINPRGVS